MINPKTVRFVDMIEKMAAKFDGKKNFVHMRMSQ